MSKALFKIVSLIILLALISMTACKCDQDCCNQEKVEIPTVDYDSKLEELGIELMEPGAPVANYVNLVQTGNLIFLAGKGPSLPEGGYITGKVGADLSQEEGYVAARQAAVVQLSVLKDYLGDLNKIKQCVKVLGMVNCTPEYGNQPEVVNGFSDLIVEVLGERGKHARAAVGMNSLPRNIAVEVEMIVEVF
jgi:enamine deaminase RidA (YjgF/YER057c/UK114 family)